MASGGEASGASGASPGSPGYHDGKRTSPRDAAARAPPPPPPAAAAGADEPAREVDEFGLPIRKAAAEPRGGGSTNRAAASGGDPASRTVPAPLPATPQEKAGPSPAGEGEDAKAAPGPGSPAGPSKDRSVEGDGPTPPAPAEADAEAAGRGTAEASSGHPKPAKEGPKSGHGRETSVASIASAASAVSGPNALSEYSHQRLTGAKPQEGGDSHDVDWQVMPAYAPYDIYDDDNKLIAREHDEDGDENYAYAGLGGAGKGYTRVLFDDDADSVTSMDDNTQYLFSEAKGTSMLDDDQQRDAVSQLEATKDLLTEGQRIAYVGLTRLELSGMVNELESIAVSKSTKKYLALAIESLKMWSQKMMIRLYTHMDISAAEQVMIEQLSEHGVMPGDLTPLLMQNARVKNPMAERSRSSTSFSAEAGSNLGSPRSAADAPPPPYETHEGEDMPDVRTPSQLPTTSRIDIDLRWTVLCDLFLVLIADSVYDARSRVLLGRVGKSLQIPWLDICRFEKRVTDALEMQQQAENENWNEDQHMESRRKMALKRRYVMMGLATVGGGLVIGLSAGLLAPVIGAGLAAGFTTIGVTGTGSFLAGAGGAAIITSSAAASGSVIGGRAAGRRTGAVRTFEYRPLHNNKRVNLIVTISGWMTGKVDDVRLPFSTVDPIMGDIYSVLWEPEMLTSMGDTINILATEALTQGLQQLLGSTILVSLMAALQLPVVLTKLSYLIDNPWAVSLDRAWAAGLILADSLVDRNLGTRPVTLVGYSLGSRVIFSCLLELSRKGALGLVQNVYMFGSPVVVKRDEWVRARTVVAGHIVNGYNRNDWILGYLFRLTNGGIRRIAGLAPVEGIPGMNNMDVTDYVVGHMDYRTAMPRLLRECGWLVESDEFSEIEDPDPDNHAQRQRELINEIEEARKELEKGKEPKGGLSGFFSRKKKGRKQEWEVYEDAAKQAGSGSRTEDQEGNNHGVLFDVDAIRAELAKEQLPVKELQSTLPPMKIPSPNPRDSLRETKSADAEALRHAAAFRPAHEDGLEEEGTPAVPRAYISPDGAHNEQTRGSHEGAQAGEARRQSEAVSSWSPPPARPDIRSSQTVPNVTLADPWADPDDEDFGEEKEISMTFA